MTDRIFLGLPGLATDVTILKETFRYGVNMYTIKEEPEIEPETFTHRVSSTLYERRFGPYFIEPVMAGLQKSPDRILKPYIAAMDLIGCLNFAKDFVVARTASSKLFGVVEGLWEPYLGPEDLFETISQTLLNVVDQDADSGWGPEGTSARAGAGSSGSTEEGTVMRWAGTRVELGGVDEWGPISGYHRTAFVRAALDATSHLCPSKAPQPRPRVPARGMYQQPCSIWHPPDLLALFRRSSTDPSPYCRKLLQIWKSFGQMLLVEMLGASTGGWELAGFDRWVRSLRAE